MMDAGTGADVASVGPGSLPGAEQNELSSLCPAALLTVIKDRLEVHQPQTFTPVSPVTHVNADL